MTAEAGGGTARAAAPRVPLWGLRIVLALLAAGNVFGLFFGLTQREALFAEFPRFDSALWPIYLSCPVAGLIAIAATWRLRTWGFWLLMALGGVVLGIELYVMGWGIHVSRIFVVTALLILCAKPLWGSFR